MCRPTVATESSLAFPARFGYTPTPCNRCADGPRRRPVKRHWPGMLGLSCLLLAAAGCANFWDEALSHERDWSYATGWGKPDPLTVIHDNLDHTPGADGLRRAQALGRL